MTVKIPCPHCTMPVNPLARFCEHCGVDLALAAVYEEQTAVPSQDVPEGVPLAPEVLVPKIGDYMIEQGLISEQDLERALQYQREKAACGENILLGQALLKLGVITQSTLDEVITTRILQLQQALMTANARLEQRVKERTAELRRALERLSELNQLKANFIANISHELRTPMTHLKGYLELLSDESLGPLNNEQREAFTILNRAQQRLERLIEDLIQFSLLSQGSLSLSPKPLDVADLIQKAVQEAEPRARAQNILLTAALPADLPLVSADEEKIGWVITQLLDNALKFTPNGGRIEAAAYAANGLLTLSVVDTGIGIPGERIDEIFEPFHQLDSSASRRYGGTGMGLAMVRQIVEAHGSQVIIHSTPGKGSRFEFSLPVLQDSAETAGIPDDSPVENSADS